MIKFTFTNFEDSIAFARSDEGAAYINEQYAGQAEYDHPLSGVFDVYFTPEAAALAVLANYSDDDLDECDEEFSVTAVRCDGDFLYGAEIGHDAGMTHCGKDDFIAFLQGRAKWSHEWAIDGRQKSERKQCRAEWRNEFVD